MTPEQTRQAAAVMLVAAEKAQIQVRGRGAVGGAWGECINPSWQWGDYDYRVKPEPRECWLVGCTAFDTLEAARIYKNMTAHRQDIVHYREVLE